MLGEWICYGVADLSVKGKDEEEKSLGSFGGGSDKGVWEGDWEVMGVEGQ